MMNSDDALLEGKEIRLLHMVERHHAQRDSLLLVKLAGIEGERKEASFCNSAWRTSLKTIGSRLGTRRHPATRPAHRRGPNIFPSQNPC